MTISSTDTRTNATATASQTAFSFDFVVYDGDDVAVYVDGVEQTSGFSVTLDSPNDLPSTGTVNFSPNPNYSGGESVVMLLDSDYTQDTDIQNASTLAEEQVETGLDKIVRMIHQLLEALARAPKLAKFSTSTDITFPEPVADNYVGWNSAGTDLENKEDTSESTGVVLGDNEVLSKVGGAAADGLPVGTNEIVARKGGTLETLAVGANELVGRKGSNLTTLAVGANELVGRFGSNLATLAVAASRIVGRASSGSLKALTVSEVRTLIGFPNVDATVTSTDEDLEALQGHSSELNTILDNYAEQTVELGGDFDSGQEVKCVRIGNLVTITSVGSISHSNGDTIVSSAGAIPAAFRPTTASIVSARQAGGTAGDQNVSVKNDGELRTFYSTSRTSVGVFTISFVVTG